jgi:colanic acid/amylovoran biosynthesis protein
MRQSSSPTLLLTNFHSLSNAGDAALLEVTLNHLRASFTQPRVILSCNYPAENGLAKLVEEVVPSPGALSGSFSGRSLLFQAANLMWGVVLSRCSGRLPPGWQRLLSAYRQADMVLSVPGNPFFSMGRFGWPLLASTASLWLAQRQGRPLYILPQTLGPFQRSWEAWLVRRLYRHARLVFMRDVISLRLAQAWGLATQTDSLPAKLALAVDPTFDLQPAAPAEAAAVLQRWGYDPRLPSLGVNILPRMVHTLSARALGSARAALAGALGRLAAQGVRLFFFAQSRGPTPQEDDRLPARQVMAALPDPTAAVLVDEELPPALLKACYGCMDAFVASRLHAGLFAVGMGVPTLFIGYLTKTRGMLETLAGLDWLIPLEEINEAVLTEKLSSLWEQRAVLRESLLPRLPGLAEAARLPVQRIAGDF